MKKFFAIIILMAMSILSAQERTSMRFGITLDPMSADSLFTRNDSIDQILLVGKILPKEARIDTVTVRDSVIIHYANHQKALTCPIEFSFSPDHPTYATSMLRCGNIEGFDTVDTFALDSLTIRVSSLYSPDTIVKHPIENPERFDYDLIRLVEKAFAGKDSTRLDILVTNLPKHVIKELFEQAPADVILNFDYVPTRCEDIFDGKTMFVSLATEPRTILTIERKSGTTRISRR